jgi:hypothetical protein
MALYTPKKVPLNWYRFDVKFSVELLVAYVDGVEAQVNRSIEEFRAGHQEDAGQEVRNEGYVAVSAHYAGLDDSSWDLASIFESYFPNLQRQSALITLCGFFEHELLALCSLFQKDRGHKFGLGDLKGAGIERAITYLERVVGLNIDKSSALWAEIRSIQAVRNLIVHDAGKLTYQDGMPRKSERQYVEASPHLSGDEEISIAEGYLRHVLDTFDQFFKNIGDAVERLYGLTTASTRTGFSATAPKPGRLS